ncbi:GTP cyclohydrolase II [Terasakiella pusilla]|uniref:GTP cyclohydrolase II n=1 Tax=Terasakiella pusilla TaxID=64973 RepID=UPI003AA7BF71
MPHRLSITLTETETAAHTPSLLTVDRAISDLRRGQIVVIEDDSGALTLTLASEGATKTAIQRLKSLSNHQPHLILTSTRVHTLGLGQFNNKAVCVEMGKALRPDLIEGLVNPLATISKNDFFDITFSDVPLQSGESASVGLTKLARLIPSSITARIETEDKPENLDQWLKDEHLLRVKAADIFGYEEMAARSLRAVSDAQVPLADAPNTKIVAFRPADGGIEHFAIIIGTPDSQDPVLIRIHSECFTGDLVGSLRCDCGDQLRGAIKSIADQGSGILLYLAQEGRGIGLVNKLRAYKLQDTGVDTFDANEQLGFDADERVYLPAAQMLSHLGVNKVRLMTNNPEKVSVLKSCNVDVVERVEHAFETNKHNEPYIFAKATKGGHYL